VRCKSWVIWSHKYVTLPSPQTAEHSQRHAVMWKQLPAFTLHINQLDMVIINAVFLQCFDTVGWVIWPIKPVPDITYNVFGGTLNLAVSIYHHINQVDTVAIKAVLPLCLGDWCGVWKLEAVFTWLHDIVCFLHKLVATAMVVFLTILSWTWAVIDIPALYKLNESQLHYFSCRSYS